MQCGFRKVCQEDIDGYSIVFVYQYWNLSFDCLSNYDELSVHIEYIVTAEEGIKVFESAEKLDDFLNEQKKEDVDIIDLREDRQEYKNDIPMLVASDELTPKEEKEIKELTANGLK